MLVQIADSLGKRFAEKTSDFREFLHFFGESIRQMFLFARQRQVATLVLMRQILFTGFEALTLISLIAAAIGGLIIIEGHLVLGDFGQGQLLNVILVTVIVRELSSLLVAFIIIARSGTAISTELGNMIVNHEIEALQSIGISPLSYLVVPRVFGVVAAMLTLTIYFNIIGLIGGWAVSYAFFPIGLEDFYTGLLSELQVVDVFSSFTKSIIFGFAIGTIACYQGMKVAFASTEVPQRTIKAVVQSLTWVIILDILLTTAFYVI
ncbi:MAG: ABC transporter permease [Bacteroidetes bacterium]|nr:ABC transporter permease [Bacteroidota bacterium]